MRISKRLILILLAIIAITLTCVISSSEAYESEFKGGSIGDTLKISYLNGTWGDNWPYSYEYNKNIYCMQKGTKPGEGAFTIKTIVEITNDQITSAKGTNSNGAEVDFLSKIKEHQTSSDVKNANAQLAKIVELADKAKASRERTYGDGMLMQKDPYQWLMWRHLDTWVNTSIYNGNSTLKSELKSHFHGSANYNSSYNSAAKSSYDKSNTIWNEQIKNYKSSQELVDISLKTDENKSVIENYNTYQENGVNYSILGPFYLTYGGTISEFKVKLSGDTELDVSKDFKVGVYTGDSQSFEIIEDLKNIPKNGNEIYLSIAEDKLQNKTKLDVNIKVKGTSSRVTTIYILKNNNGKQMYMGTKQTLGPGEVSASATYTLNLNEDVVLKKQNENGEAVPGVKFEIHNSEGEYEGTFTTNENGETNVIKLKAGETYTITEILNSEYGYKDVTIADAEITKGAGKITNVIQADNKFDVVITEDTTITIKNTSKLGKFTLVKEGENAEPLEGVQFVVYQSGLPGYEGYLKFESLIEGFGTVDALDFNRKYVTDRNEATIFTTGKDGMITIENLEVYSGPSTKFGYWVTEINNENYGYKKIELTDTDVKINDNGEIITSKTEVDKNTVGFEIHKQAVLTIPNKQELAKLEIEKVGENGTKLENVQIKIKVGEEQYIQLTDSNETIVKEVKGQVTINPNNIANLQEYKVNYITSKADATIFKTDENGKITINNLEVNASNTKKYSYTACEIYNPNYGYGSVENINLEEKLIELKLNETNQIKLTNKQKLNGIQAKKHDETHPSIVLPDVGFVIEITQADKDLNKYLALYKQDGSLQKEEKGTITINSNNVANSAEYSIGYVDNKENATTFITGNDGILTVNNLEVYSSENNKVYQYKLIETVNRNPGYEVDSENPVCSDIFTLENDKNEMVNITLANKLKYIKISGYVWVEGSSGKANEYDGVYTNEEVDKKLKDLYLTDENGKVTVPNKKATIPVQVKLRNKSTGGIVKELPEQFDKDGKYTFTDIEVEQLSNYEVVFIYNGFYYTTLVQQLEKTNGSKVVEVPSERETLNNKFTTVKDNSEIVDEKGNLNKVNYNKQGHISTLESLKFDATLSANTTLAQYSLSERFNTARANGASKEKVEVVEGLDDVNMGLVLREQPTLSINSNIYSVLVDFEGYQYNYKYNGRQNYYENTNNDKIGVNFEEKFSSIRYTRTVYASDIQKAANDANTNIKVAVTYRIDLTNQSSTLKSMPKQLINYFDSRYDIKSVGLELDKETNIATNTLTHGKAQPVEGVTGFNSTVIDFNQVIDSINSGNGNNKSLYITFDVQRSAIIDLLNQKSTYHNVTEVLSYASYYGENTSKVDGKQYITDVSQAGSVYAGIDTISQPGNAKIELVDHATGEGTKVPDTTYFEDDTTYAPSLLLQAEEREEGVRRISGTIWEDIATNTTNNQKLGDGIFNTETEKRIKDVIVTLHKVDENDNIDSNIAKYSNGESAQTTTNEEGNYTFGYYKEENGVKKYVGVLPGRYVIKYTYNGNSYIVGGNNIDPNDYKSTIIASEVVKSGFEANKQNRNERWYLTSENNRYSDARDDIALRPEYDPRITENFAITNSTYNNILKVESMTANTPIMDIGIEFTAEDTADAVWLDDNGVTKVKQFVSKTDNIDFGIIERPNIDIQIEKEVTSLEIVAQNGTNIVPKGNPSDAEAEMQHVKTGIDGLVPIEIEPDIIHGAQLNVEYTITVINNSDTDYLEKEYYYYGEGGVTEITAKVSQVVDYLDSTMSLDPSKEEANSIWEEKGLNYLYTEDGEDNDLISKEVYNKLKAEDGNYHILTIDGDKFQEVQSEEDEQSKKLEVKLYATKALAASDSIYEENKVEIIEVKGRRTISEAIPGNLVPSEPNDEPDDDKVTVQILPPTGITTQYIPYIIAGLATCTILVLGIVIIKKIIIK